MERCTIDGIELDYEVTGAGEAVLLIHGGFVADGFLPLRDSAALRGYELVRYNRRGFAGSTLGGNAVSIARQAQDCEALLATLGIVRAHVVGHSYGGTIALQLAAQAPALVHTLTLAEPGLMGLPGTDALMSVMMPIFEMYGSGNAAEAIRMSLRSLGRANAEEIIERVAPGATNQAIKDADTYFQIEMPALQEWVFGAEEAKSIDQPVLHIAGADSLPIFREGLDLLRSWLPQTEQVVIAGASHLLQQEAPEPFAQALGEFLSRHPIR
jgi:pimeloyl-ACP methyl ester carboxylesterase